MRRVGTRVGDRVRVTEGVYRGEIGIIEDVQTDQTGTTFFFVFLSTEKKTFTYQSWEVEPYGS